MTDVCHVCVKDSDQIVCDSCREAWENRWTSWEFKNSEHGAAGVIGLRVAPEHLARAQARLARIAVLPNRRPNQFGHEPWRTLDGYIGEEIVAAHLGVKLLDLPDYDFMLREMRYDVKTVTCSTTPEPSFLAVVNSCELGRQHKQKTDRYLFVRLLFDKTRAWLCGWISAADFMESGRFVKKGYEMFPGQRAEKADCTCLPIFDLHGVETLKETQQELPPSSDTLK